MQPHAVDAPADAVSGLYRHSITSQDLGLASTYWEAAWIEGAHSTFYSAYQSLRFSDNSMRAPVMLARPEDRDTSLLSSDFLAMAFTAGALEDAPSPDATYGMLPKRVRERVAWDLAGRLRLYPDRLLVVLGAQTAEDVELLSIAFEDNPIRNMSVLLVDSSEVACAALTGLHVPLEVFDGQLAELLERLSTVAPLSTGKIGGVPIRVGGVSASVDPSAVELVEKRFKLVRETDLLPPDSVSKQDLMAFLDGDLGTLSMFASDVLPVERAYRTDRDATLGAEIKAASVHLSGLAGSRYFHLRLPAEGGAGATTLAREAAVEAAAAGIPALILKPGQVDVDVDDVGAFLVAISDSLSGVGPENPPFLLVFDAEHHGNVLVHQVGQALALQARRPVILEVVPEDSETETRVERRDEHVTLPCLHASLMPEEIEACHRAFEGLRDGHGMDFLAVPTEEDWNAYDRHARYTTPDGSTAARTTFWVTLRFFLLEGADLRTSEEMRAPIGEWIHRRTECLTSPQSEQLVNSVASLSYFRIACPLTTALRVSYGGRYSTDAFDTLRNLSDLMDWGDRSEDLSDQTLYFRHPDVAREYLADRGLLWDSQVMDALSPALASLVDSDADRWLAETLAATSLVRGARRKQDFDWRLRAFEAIPPVIRDTSRTVLHHLGRLLYQAAECLAESPAEKTAMLERAIASLEKALLLDSNGHRQERPGLVYNTLGTATWRLAQHLASTGADPALVEEQWIKASRNFELSIQQLPDNIEALLAYAYRLLARAGAISLAVDLTMQTEAERDDALAQALTLLDDAAEALSSYVAPDPSWQENLEEWRHAALTRLGSAEGVAIVARARDRGDVALAEYLEARRHLIVTGGEEGELLALDHLLAVFEESASALDHRGLRLLIRLIRKHRRTEFETLFAVFEGLAKDRAYSMSVVDNFRQAVLCYQTGRFDLGAERFRRLRADMREIQSAAPPQVAHDSYKSGQDPDAPAEVSLRIERVVNPLRAYGYVDEFRHEVPVKPRQFPSNPGRGDVVKANIMFGLYGPYAVPPRRTAADRPR